MQFNTIDTLVRKFYVLKEKGFVANPNYKEDLQHMLPQEEFAMFNIMFEQEALNKVLHGLNDLP